MDINRNDRAKQFFSFDALGGFREALEEKENEIEQRKELAEEIANEISNTINKIERDTVIIVKYYHQGKYIEKKGKVEILDRIKKKIILSDDTVINVDDIVKIEVV